MNEDDIKAMIEAHLQGVQAIVTGDGHHFQAIVIGDLFEGLTRIVQQRKVYEALGDNIANGNVHALSLKTFTPAQWQHEQEQ